MTSRRSLIAAAMAALLSAQLTTAATAAGADNDETANARPLKVHVLGASLADNLATGLKWRLRNDKRFVLTESTKPATGLIRRDVYDWQARLERILARNEIDIALVAIGGNDRQSFFQNNKRLRRFSPEWREVYRKRLAMFMSTLKAKVPVVYWVGLPIVSSKQTAEDFQDLNKMISAVAKEHDVRFIDIYDDFKSEDGGYSSYGVALSGRRSRLRQKDGIHFTMAGALRLGDAIADRVISDLEANGTKAADAGGTTAQ